MLCVVIICSVESGRNQSIAALGSKTRSYDTLEVAAGALLGNKSAAVKKMKQISFKWKLSIYPRSFEVRTNETKTPDDEEKLLSTVCKTQRHKANIKHASQLHTLQWWTIESPASTSLLKMKAIVVGRKFVYLYACFD